MLRWIHGSGRRRERRRALWETTHAQTESRSRDFKGHRRCYFTAISIGTNFRSSDDIAINCCIEIQGSSVSICTTCHHLHLFGSSCIIIHDYRTASMQTSAIIHLKTIPSSRFRRELTVASMSYIQIRGTVGRYITSGSFGISAWNRAIASVLDLYSFKVCSQFRNT